MPPVTSLDAAYIKSSLSHAGLFLSVGPVVYQIKSNLPIVAEGLAKLYSDYPLPTTQEFSDHLIAINRQGILRNIVGSRVNFSYDHTHPFDGMTLGQAYAFLEWGMNWCISVHHNEYLKIHAAVLAKNGKAIVMPGEPGAGKSTLSAALMLKGWRLLSDEHALIKLDEPKVVPLCRPVSLKNESIEIIQSFDNSAVFGPASLDTHKGRVAHLKADIHPDSHDANAIKVTRLIFPRFVPNAKTNLSPKTRAESFMRAAEQSFNYSTLGQQGFFSMKGLVSACECSEFIYSDLDSAVALFEQLDMVTA